MLLQQFLEDSARKFPRKTALVYENRRLNYAELDAGSNRLAHLLKECGVKRGGRVAIFLENSPEAVISIFGALKADAVFVILSPQLKPRKLGYIIENCGAGVIVSDAQKLSAAAATLAGLPGLRTVICADGFGRAALSGGLQFLAWNESFSMPAVRPPCANINLDLAAIIYTSGSTGSPKGVMLTHLNMTSAAESIAAYLESVPGDVIINLLPLSFDYGLYQVLICFKAGATLVLERSFAWPYSVVKRIIDEGVTGFPGVPTIFALLFQMKNLDRYDFSSLRYVTSTGANLPVKHIRRLREIFPAAKIYSMYGLTECKRVSYLPPGDIDRKPESIGRGMPNQELWIVDEQGRRVGPGVIGELVVRGSHVMKGYWSDPEATSRALRPGPHDGERVLYTGDLFRMDEEGYLYFVSRMDDMIKTRGERVSPREVENALHEMEGVAEAAVVPVSDGVLGNAIKAFIVPRPGYALDRKDLVSHCRSLLEDFAVPRYFEIRESLPRSGSGKIDKPALQQSQGDQGGQIRVADLGRTHAAPPNKQDVPGKDGKENQGDHGAGAPGG
ncbi:MAG: AMP-binding protein [Syntrophaceae bacterium]